MYVVFLDKNQNIFACVSNFATLINVGYICIHPFRQQFIDFMLRFNWKD